MLGYGKGFGVQTVLEINDNEEPLLKVVVIGV